MVAVERVCERGYGGVTASRSSIGENRRGIDSLIEASSAGSGAPAGGGEVLTPGQVRRSRHAAPLRRRRWKVAGRIGDEVGIRPRPGAATAHSAAGTAVLCDPAGKPDAIVSAQIQRCQGESLSELVDGLLRVPRTEGSLHHGRYFDAVTGRHESDDGKCMK